MTTYKMYLFDWSCAVWLHRSLWFRIPSAGGQPRCQLSIVVISRIIIVFSDVGIAELTKFPFFQWIFPLSRRKVLLQYISIARACTQRIPGFSSSDRFHTDYWFRRWITTSEEWSDRFYIWTGLLRLCFGLSVSG